MKHTPGPWIYDAGAFYAQCQLTEHGMTRESPIAEMLNGREGDYKANARLIAAAPDLLEAAVQASGVLAYCLAHGYIDSMATAAPKKALAGLDAAIAKATGD